MANVIADTGNVNIQSNGTNNSLTVAMGNGSTLTASTGNVNFNSASAGAVTILSVHGGGPFGLISANNGNGLITFNGGNDPVRVNIGSISGEVIGAGAGNLIGSSFSLTSQSGIIALGPITSPGTITVINNDDTAGNGTNGRIYVYGAISSTGSHSQYY